MIEVLNDDLSMDGMRRVRVMSDGPLSEGMMLRYVPRPVQAWACFDCDRGTGLRSALNIFYGEVKFPCREMVEIRLEGMARPRRMAVWKFLNGDRVSEVAIHVAHCYFELTGRMPGFGFMRKLPQGVEAGIPLTLKIATSHNLGGHELILLEADWALDGCIMLGG